MPPTPPDVATIVADGMGSLQSQAVGIIAAAIPIGLSIVGLILLAFLALRLYKALVFASQS
jgi:hypothetical protein